MLLALASRDKIWPRRVAGVVAIIGFTNHVLFGTVPGVLIVSLLLYRIAPWLTGTEPWGPQELALWFSSLSDEVRASVGGSLVTILGFFIALQTAMLSWKKQTATTLRMAASDNLDRICSNMSATMLRMQLFIDRTANEVLRIRRTRSNPEDETILTLLAEDVPAFRSDRERLSQLSQEFSNVCARYSVLFMPLAGAQEALDAIDSQVSSVLKVMWVPVPAGGTADRNHRTQLASRADPPAYAALAKACEDAQDEIAGLHGGLRGALTSAVVDFNLVAMRRVFRTCFRAQNTEA